jgi:outer membrane lipoprotein SlyB
MKRVWIAILVSAQLLLGAIAAQSEVFVYPAKGQSADQQGKDEYECSKWAKSQSGVDPSAPAAQPVAGEHARGTVGGAARGAAVGAGIGAIAGDAGKGAAIGAVAGGVRGRRGSMAQQQAAGQEERNAYDRAFAVCVEGRGYTAK